MKTCRIAWPLLLAVACTAPVEPLPAPSPPALLRMTIVFEPPLAEPAHLVVSHESGWRWRGEVAPSGVELDLPPGPASLLLEVGEQLSERVVRVAPGMPTVVWGWRDSTATMPR